MSDQIGIIGAGAWGTTLAVLLADAQRPGEPAGSLRGGDGATGPCAGQ